VVTGMPEIWDNRKGVNERGAIMAAQKPRTGDGPMEATREGRLIVVRVPLEGGGRMAVSMNDDEVTELHALLGKVVKPAS